MNKWPQLTQQKQQNTWSIITNL